MTSVILENEDTIGIASGLQAIANQPAVQFAAAPFDSQDATFPGYAGVPDGVIVDGTGFTYDATGKLIAGTINNISVDYPSSDGGSGRPGSVFYEGLSLSVASADFLATLENPAASLLLGGGEIDDGAPQATGFAGNDVFLIEDYLSSAPDRSMSVDGGGGVNIALFGTFSSEATVNGSGGGRESVVLAGQNIVFSIPPGGSLMQSPLTVNLVAVDTLKFLDGSFHEDGSSPGAQASLEFQGILGRTPDTINAGGYGALAEQNGTTASATAILDTPEGQADTANLSNTDYVTRLYQNILGRAPDAQSAAALQAGLDNGTLSRPVLAAQIAASTEAQAANASAFATGPNFAADPGSVDVLRAYEVLLNRLPDQNSLGANTGYLDAGLLSLQTLYKNIQASPEFKADQGSNPYGLTTVSSYASIFAVTHSDALSVTNIHLIAASGGVPFIAT